MKFVRLVAGFIILLTAGGALSAQHRSPSGQSIPRARQAPVIRDKSTAARPADVALQGDRHNLLERADQAATILREFLDAPDRNVPQSILDRATCVAVVPGLKKGGLGFGGQWGRGVISCRNDARGWSPPSFFTLSGGSFGLQIGFQVVDLVMVISTRSGLNSLLRNKVEIGADAGATGLLIGRTVGVSTDPLLNAKVFSYSRSQGLFAGLELKGAWLGMDHKANRLFYGDEVHTHEILSTDRMGNMPPASALYSYSRTLKEISPAKAKYVKVRKVEKPASPTGQSN